MSDYFGASTQQDIKTGGDGAKSHDWNVLNASNATAIDVNISNAGYLTMVMSGGFSAWYTGSFTAPFVYINVIGDFDVDVSITTVGLSGTNSVERPFLAVRDPNASAGEDWILLGRDTWDGPSGQTLWLWVMNSVENGNRTTLYNYLRLTRVGNVFRYYGKVNQGDSWTTWTAVERNDFHSIVQLGFMCAHGAISDGYTLKADYLQGTYTLAKMSVNVMPVVLSSIYDYKVAAGYVVNPLCIASYLGADYHSPQTVIVEPVNLELSNSVPCLGKAVNVQPVDITSGVSWSRFSWGNGQDFVGSLSLDTPHEIVSALSLEAYFSVIDSILDGITGGLNMISSIAHSDIGTAVLEIINGLGIDGAIDLINKIREGIAAEMVIINAIDAALDGEIEIIPAIEDFFEGEIEFLNSIGTAGMSVSQSVQVYVDDTDYTGEVISCDIDLYKMSGIAAATVALKSLDIISGEKMTIIEGDEFSFYIEEYKQDAGNHTVELWGRALAAEFYEGRALKKDYAFYNRTATSIAEELIGADKLIWQIQDFVVKEFSEEGYPLDTVRAIVEDAGAVARAINDTVYVVYPYEASVPVIALQHNFSLSRQRNMRQADGVKVTYGKEEILSIEADKTTLGVGEYATVKVYTRENYTFETSADYAYKDASGNITEVEEDVTIENGEGSLSKPVISVISITGCSGVAVNGQKVTSKPACKLVTIKYQTVFDKWKVTNYTEGKRLVCTAVTDNTVTIISGSGGTIEEITAEVIRDSYSAKKRAEKELTERSGPEQAAITHIYDSLLISPEGINVKTPYGDGVITGVDVKVEANPVRVKMSLEVLLWQAKAQ
ncbi:hypothetical protein [Candidatus Magnetominusculus xianensis]|uniref:Uncharacterized protein n=1 Tax=Candidatus Magnetominusculus xianensis TaxID=1748249 RepID=A0ABR5SCK9_9BACT|nr:hypothetical protein [Candidatus Magnetominusculus xianensis]KWT81135.1 hypothetical protein ASN18_2641 [Candidatus Magnetominusculus xianensis]MBF0402965.1 hypothetical protein [Nitrospirota bacterium]